MWYRVQELEGVVGRCIQLLSNLTVALNNAMEQWSYFNCNEMKSSALTIVIEVVKYSYSNCRLFIAPRRR